MLAQLPNSRPELYQLAFSGAPTTEPLNSSTFVDLPAKVWGGSVWGVGKLNANRVMSKHLCCCCFLLLSDFGSGQRKALVQHSHSLETGHYRYWAKIRDKMSNRLSRRPRCRCD